MKKIFLSGTIIAGMALTAFSQKVNVDQDSGLVTVDDKPAFYLLQTNKTLISNDFILQNIDHEELAYLKYQLISSAGKKNIESNVEYLMYFRKSTNYCYIRGFSIAEPFRKHVAEEIARMNLVKDGMINMTDEQKFVIIHEGKIALQNFIPSQIMLKGDNIYNSSELIGRYKLATDSNIDSISFFNKKGTFVCSATRDNRDDMNDWKVKYQERNLIVLYTPDNSIQRLSAYLADNGIL